MGPIAHFSEIETLRRETKSLQPHLGEIGIPIGETEVTRVYGSGYVKGTRWRRMDQIGGAEFDFRFRKYLDLREWLRALEHITKHFEQVDH